MQRAKVSSDCGADGPLRLVQQPSYDCRSAYGEDEELEHCGEPTILFELVDDHVQHSSDAPDREHVNESQHSNVPSPGAGRRHFVR
jgi:hypothetical protein